MPSGQPQISVCIPAYNATLYIDKCIESILSQSFGDFELIIVEDCSSDDTLSKLEAWSAKDTRIKLMRHEKNKGVSGSYNDALQSAEGKYVAIIDNDDYILPGYLENLHSYAESNQADIVQMGFEAYKEVDGKEVPHAVWVFPKQAVLFSPSLSKRLALYSPLRLHISPWGKLYRRDFLEKMKMRFHAARVAFDVLFHYQGLITAPRYVGLPLRLYHYRERVASYSHKIKFPREVEEYFSTMIRHTKLLADWLREMNLWEGNKAWQRAAIDGYLLHYSEYFARQVKEIGADEVLTVLDEMAEKTYGENAPAFQSTLRAMVLSRLRPKSTPQA